MVESILLFCLVLGVAGFYWWLYLYRPTDPALPLSERSREYREHPWCRVAERLDLLTVGKREPRELIGEIRGVPVRISRYNKSQGRASGDDRTLFEVGGRRESLPATTMGAYRSSAPILGRGDYEVGDPDFDSRIRIQTEHPSLLRAALDHHTRRRLIEIVESHHGRFSDGVIQTVFTGHGDDPHEIAQHTRWLVSLAERLNQEPDSAPNALAQIARSDPLPAVQLGALQSLLSDWPDAPATRVLVSNLVSGRGTSLLMAHAAAAMGSEGVDKLWECVTADIDPHTREFALGALVGQTDAHDLAEMAAELLDSEIRAAAARTLGSLGIGGFDDRLGRLLDDDREDVRAAAYEALGAAGTIDSVERLLPSTKGLLRSSEVKALARLAIARIQDRHEYDGAGDFELNRRGRGRRTSRSRRSTRSERSARSTDSLVHASRTCTSYDLTSFQAVSLLAESPMSKPIPATPLAVAVLALTDVCSGCGTDESEPSPPEWTSPIVDASGDLLSVHGTSAEDVWTVGADDGVRPHRPTLRRQRVDSTRCRCRSRPVVGARAEFRRRLLRGVRRYDCPI